MLNEEQLGNLLESARQTLLDARTAEGTWQGRLSSSPLATAVSVFALHAVDPAANRELITNGLRWLGGMQHPDGGWGDAERLDPPNLSSTLLCYAAILSIAPGQFQTVLQKAQAWIVQQAGSMRPQDLSEAVYRAYGKDRTFAVPILTMCAIAGILGEDGWTFVAPLPFEFSLLPRTLFRFLKLTVVSYALPALIAIGQVKNHFNPPSNLLIRLLRHGAVCKSLRLLEHIQPSNGGFLEAAPLTSFVAMSLASIGLKAHPVVQKGVQFLRESVRSDGSWPIDTNLSMWCTSLAIEALLKHTPEALPLEWRKQTADWYVKHQFKQTHPYTGAHPGGWAWTCLPGAVPDADDTAGALIALYHLGIRDEFILQSVRSGLQWLLDVQNTDGGVPTFCRGWGKLEFDRSCPDITAHAIAAWQCWKSTFDVGFQDQLSGAVEAALDYLMGAQQQDGSWLPLWFGNPFMPDHSNPVYGTARVLKGLQSVQDAARHQTLAKKAVSFLLDSQNADLGWGSQRGAKSTIEETSLVIDALCPLIAFTPDSAIVNSVHSGFLWMTERLGGPKNPDAAPIGLYFAKLWYAEDIYPIIWQYSALKSFIALKI